MTLQSQPSLTIKINNMSLHTLLEEQERKFDQRFGTDGPDKDSDSFGRKAGCDDCSTSIEIRQEHKEFNRLSSLKLIAGIREMIESKKEQSAEIEHEQWIAWSKNYEKDKFYFTVTPSVT